MQREVIEYLESIGISFKIKPHSNPVYTSEDAARERGVQLSQIVKTMIGQDGEGKIHVAMIPGDKILKLKRLRQVAGSIRIELSEPTELESRFGLTVGAISPIQFINTDSRFYMDKSVLDEEFVNISSGKPDAGVELSSRNLRDILNATVCEIVSTSQ
jgi:Cys-tRNA(Pro) deacylase